MPLTVAVVTIHAGQAFAQSAFPAPLPNGQAAPASKRVAVSAGERRGARGIGGWSVPFPSTGAAPVAGLGIRARTAATSQAARRDACMKGFVPLREEAEKRGKLIKAASDRKASPDEACKLIGSYGQAELKMIKYVETNSAKCGIPPQIAEQLKNGHKNTEKMQKQVCTVAQQGAQAQRAAAPSLSEVLGSSAALPEAQTVREGRQHVRYAERQRSHPMTAFR